MIIDDFSNPKRKLTVSEASAANDYFTRRKSEEDRIAGIKAPAKNKKNPANTDYAKRRKQQDVEESFGRRPDHGREERHDLDPSDWYIVKDGKMFAASIYPRQVKQAEAEGFSRTKAEARARAGSEGVAEGKESPEKEIERLKLRQDAEHGHAPLRRQAATQARIRELEKQIKGKQGVAEGKEDKIAQLKKDHATAVHWSKNETSPQKREAARQKAEKIKSHLEKQYKQGVAEAAKWRDPKYQGKTFDYDDSYEGPHDTRPGRVSLDRAGMRQIDTFDPLEYKARKKQATGKLTPKDVKYATAQNFGKEKQQQLDYDRSRKAEQGVAEGSGGNWYIRVNGKILNDTKFKPVIFSSEGEARSHAMKLADKKRIPLSQMKLTKSWMDAPEQGVAEGEYDSRKPFGVRYKVFAGREGRVTTKEYWTTSEEKLQKAVDKIQALDNFYEIDGYSYPKESQGVSEAKNLKKRVKIVKGPDAGKTGWIREIKHGAFKGAPKSYYIDLDDGGQANNLPGAALRLIKDQSLSENAQDLHVGDPVIITGNGIKFEGATGEIVDFGRDNRFVVVNLYNHGPHSFHSSDVSFNEYAGSDDEEARMYDAGEFGDDYRDETDEARMSAAQRLSTAWDRQRAKSDASLRRTPSSIPKTVDKERMIRDIATSDASPEHKKVAIDAVMKTMSESRVQRQQLLAKMLNSR